jgi:hypothetical protein
VSGKKKSSTLPDLADHLPGADFQASDTVVIGEQQSEGEVISGAHTLIIGPSGATEPPGVAEEVLESDSPTGTAVIGERTAGGVDTTVLPGVAGSKSEQPSQTGLISESRTTGPVDEEPVSDPVEEEKVEKKGRKSLSTQLDIPAIRPHDVAAMVQEAEKAKARPAEPESAGGSTIVMGSISMSEPEVEVIEDESDSLYRDAMTAPFGLEPPADEPVVQPEIPAQQSQEERAAGGGAAQHQPATTAEFSGMDAPWNPPPPVTNPTVTNSTVKTSSATPPPVTNTAQRQSIVALEAETDRDAYARMPSTADAQAQKRGPVIASIVAAVIVLGLSAFVIYWLVSGGSAEFAGGADCD